MRVGLVKSIAAFLVGTGCALAQSPVPGRSMLPRTGQTGLQPPPRLDASYPQTSGQQPYVTPLSSDPGPGTATQGVAGSPWGTDVENPYRIYASADYLLWRVRSPSLPSLTANVPVGVVQIAQPIFINGAQQVNTPVFSVPFTVSNNPGLPNANKITLGDQNGARLTLGAWFDAEKDCGVEVSGFWLEKRTEQFRATTANVNNQFNLDTGIQSQAFVTPPGGGVTLISTAEVVVPAQGRSDLFGTLSSELWGGEANARTSGYVFGPATFGFLTGVRYLEFNEKLNVLDTVSLADLPGKTTGAALGVLPITFRSLDLLRTTNRVVAPQIGADVDLDYGCFFFNARGKVALGADFQEVNAFGRSSSSTPTGGTLNSIGGLLSGPGNQGTIDKTRVVCIPEINLKVGYQWGSCMRIFAGYDALYLQHMVRTAQQVSFTNTTTQVQVASSSTQIGVQQPVINLKDLDVWVQGISFGLEFRY